MWILLPKQICFRTFINVILPSGDVLICYPRTRGTKVLFNLSLKSVRIRLCSETMKLSALQRTRSENFVRISYVRFIFFSLIMKLEVKLLYKSPKNSI